MPGGRLTTARPARMLGATGPMDAERSEAHHPREAEFLTTRHARRGEWQFNRL